MNTTMNTTTKITTNEQMVAALKAARIPAAVAANIALIYPVADIRRIIAEQDTAKLKEVAGVGTRRAETVIASLKDRIPKALSRPCPDIRLPSIEMHPVKELTLAMDDGKARLVKTADNRKRYGPALQKLQQLSDQQDVTFTTVSVIDTKDPAEEYQLRQHWNRAVHNGIVTKSGKKFVPAVMGTNAKMHCKIHWADEQYVGALHSWMDCGADMSKPQNIAKASAYRGLLLPYTQELVGGYLNADMECIVPSWNNEKKGNAILFSPEGNMQPVDTTTTNEFDGQCYFEMTPKITARLNRHEQRRLMRSIAKFNGGTLRAPMQKGLIVTGFHFHQALHDMGVHTIGGKDIDDIAILGDQTIFKAVIGEDGLYRKFEDYAVSFKALGHRFGLLLENHGPRNSYLPAQQLQAAYGADKETIEQGAAEEVMYLKEAADPVVAMRRYAPRTAAQIAENDPSFASVWFCQGLANQKYQQERNTALAGRTHDNSVVGFVVRDPIAHMQWIASLEGKRTEKPEGFLKANQVYAPEAGFTGEAVASRNPVIACYGLPIVHVTEDAGEYSQYFDDGFGFIVTGIHDNMSKLLRYDQDGDKIRLTTAPWFIRAVKNIQEQHPHYGLFAEWESFGTVEKHPATEANFREFYASCTATPTLGLNVDMAGKLLANGQIGSYEDQLILDYTMNRGTDCKQGMDSTTIPGEAGKCFDRLITKAQDMQYTLSQRAGKALKGREIDEEKVQKAYGNGNCDVIAKAVAEQTPESLEFSGSFRVEDLIIHRFRSIEGLIKCGTPQNGYADEGLFNQLVRRSAKEWEAIDQEQKYKYTWEDWRAYTRQQALAELTAFAEGKGLTLEDVYDDLTTHILLNYAKAYNNPAATDKKRQLLLMTAGRYLDWFGDMMVDTYCRNRSIDGLKVPQPVECEEIDL